jgi:DNA-binding transcriptional ArsR family regulator
MPKQSIVLNRVFAALADPTRRAVIARLCSGPAPVSELAEPFDMALPSFTQHLNVLEDCGLVKSAKTGRVRTYEIAPRALETAEQWMVDQRSMWQARLNQLDSYLKTLKRKKS